MTQRLRRCVTVALACAVWGTVASAAEYRVGRPVMGTVLQVTVCAADGATARRLAEAALREAQHWDDVLTTWRPEGELARLNRVAGQGPTKVGPDLLAALGHMRALFSATGGAFDPAVGRAVDRWRGAVPGPALPKASNLQEALAISGDQVSLQRGSALDAGGIGKGIAVDAMISLLRRAGATAAFIDFGGSSLHALGGSPDDPEGWTVVASGLGPGEILGTIVLRDASLSTSRSSGPGDLAGPIVDPRDGAPIPAGRLATVLAADGTSADAWSTALVVLGFEGLEKAKQNGVEALVQVGSEVRMTGGMKEEISLRGRQ